MSRRAELVRETNETRVSVYVDLDGTGNAQIDLRLGLLRHMLVCLASHSMFDLRVTAQGDLDHHISEDVALCLGEAIRTAISPTMNVVRFGSATVPMDCSLVTVALDLGGRPYSVIDMNLRGECIEGWRSEDIRHFLSSLSTTMRAGLHVVTHYSQNDHHCVEAVFKALALSLRQAVALDPRRTGVPSSKGVV